MEELLRSGLTALGLSTEGISQLLRYGSMLLEKNKVMMQSRTHTCGELRLTDAGKAVKLVGWMENVREVGSNFAFVVLRDFYGTTQVVIETEEMLGIVKSLNKESTISVEGAVRERDSKNAKIPTGEIEVVPAKIEVLGRCRHNELPFQINRSREADETTRLKYRYLDLRNPAVKQNIILRCQVVAALRQSMTTEKLYYADPFLYRFTAAVVSCEPAKTGWRVVLDRTAFYPEGGGQPSDHGTLDGIPVTDVHEQDGVIFHICGQAVETGRTVEGVLDWERRFDHMEDPEAAVAGCPLVVILLSTKLSVPEIMGISSTPMTAQLRPLCSCFTTAVGMASRSKPRKW